MHPSDTRSRNPRMQCDACGKWSRLHISRIKGLQFIYGGCSVTGDNHNAAGDSQDVCDLCCKTKCKKTLDSIRTHA